VVSEDRRRICVGHGTVGASFGVYTPSGLLLPVATAALPTVNPEGLPSRGPQEASRLAAALEGVSLPEVLRWAVAHFGERLAIGTSFGKDGLVLLDHLRTMAPTVPVLFLETGYHFPETLALRDQLVSAWGIHVVNIRPPQTVEEQDREFGKDLFTRDPDLCCFRRKVDPLRRELLGYDAWLTGVRRDQHAGRAAVPLVEWQELDPGIRGIFKLNPLAAWSRGQVDAYLDDHHLPRHPLWEQGYASIGCAPCTRKLRLGESERAGRWSGTGKVECGIHLMGKPSSPTS
jgi:phosphoadenosine phosphosulfate reductase